MFWLAIGIILLTSFLLIVPKKRNKNLPPGPKGFPFVGNIQDLDTSNIHQCLHRLAQKYGPVLHIKLFQRNIVVLGSGEVLRKAFRAAEFREVLNDKPKGFYGTYLVYNHQDVLLGPYSDVTFRLKSVMHKGLQPAMKEYVVEKEARDLIERFKIACGKDQDPHDTIRPLLGNLLAFVISGVPKTGDSDLMWNFVDTSNELLNPSIETVLKNFPILRKFPGKYSRLYMAARESRDAVLRRFLDEYKNTFTPGMCRGLVDMCLNIQSEDKDSSGQCWLTDDMIKALILDVIGAGLIATSNSIIGGLLTLMHHQDVVIKMRTELDHVIGKERLPTSKDQSNLPYCHAVILEVLRYTTVVPLVNHFCSKQDVIFDGFTIPKNTMVWGNFWSAHHDEAVFTDNWEFRPDRFLDGGGLVLPTDHSCRQTLFPFGLGARVCVGDDFAKTRLFVFLTALVQHFDILPPSEKELLSCDPRLYHSGAVLQMDRFSCILSPVE